MCQPAQLIEPTTELADEYAAFAADCRADSRRDHIHGAGALQAFGSEDFSTLVKRCQERARGESLPEGFVPDSIFWLTCSERILGAISLRHALTENLRRSGGHIGYSIRPCERAKGLATLMLKLTLEKARELDLEQVLITCSLKNIGSARVIQKNGGKLEAEGLGKADGKKTQRYWIKL